MSDMDWNEELDEHEQGGNGNVDELISVLRQGYSIQRPEGDKLPAEPPEGASLPTDAQNFEPDFGNAFDDYGDYEQERPAPVQRTKKRKSHIKRLPFPFVVKLAIYLAIIVGLGYLAADYAWKLADDALALTRSDEQVEIVINENDSFDEVAATLKEAGAINYEWLFKYFCRFKGLKEDYFDPGFYTVNLTYDYNALVNNLVANAGSRETVTLMIIEGSNSFDIYDLLEKNKVCSREKLEQAAANYPFISEFLQGLEYGEANRLEGYLFPDTYEFYLMDEPEDVLARFLRNFNSKLTDEMMESIRESGYSLREIITMASIVEAEAANDNERGKIASVMYNRLSNWEKPTLGMDSTVYYAAILQGASFSVELDDPYNTYMYPGIPPGPICNPGINSIRAVLYPEQTDYYYFATGVDKVNHFFETEEEFTAFLNSDQYRVIVPGQ